MADQGGYVKAGAKFKLNRAGLNELANRGQTTEAMVHIAEQVLPRVVANGGLFTKGYKVIPRKTLTGAGARLGTDHPFAHWDEWGSINRVARAPLRRALASAGLLSKTRMK